MKIIKSDKEWHEILTPLQYSILREKATETIFSSKFLTSLKKGVYACVACSNPLFSSESKFDSGSGWPSFSNPLSKDAVIVAPIKGEEGAEVLCSSCEGHLGHVFLDGPLPEGKRFCINGAILKFIPLSEF